MKELSRLDLEQKLHFEYFSEATEQHPDILWQKLKFKYDIEIFKNPDVITNLPRMRHAKR